MLYLGIDQHARQLTISFRNEEGDVLQARQVSTKPEKVNAFFAHLTVNVSGTLRRNVLGAIAIEKNDRNFPQRQR
ncbi:hypothetical protein [Bythopirellula polymerisocia]|uniref:Uncharacterized protein n=1 Tax=Bythopirellula polymerisocia TaxID=2528003 RepID=A0A5C6CQC7_9BACT|nr:hypothetical protein [Bythopirellula polymerisocia]TWU25714.1 hypothetical protein Pla144_29240 [Bythopirellula polymerisocia]